MRALQIETRPSYKIGADSYSFGNADALDSKKKPIRVVQANVQIPTTADEIVEWFGGVDFIAKGVEYLTRPLFIRLMRESLIGLSADELGKKTSEERDAIVAEMTSAVEGLTSLKPYLVEEATNAVKLNFADEVTKLDPTAPDFNEKFLALRQKHGL